MPRRQGRGLETSWLDLWSTATDACSSVCSPTFLTDGVCELLIRSFGATRCAHKARQVQPALQEKAILLGSL